MKKKFLTRIAPVFLALMLLLTLSIIPATPAAAATYQEVTVTATPSYIEIACDDLTFTINEETGDSTIEPSTTYYSNPLGDTTVPSATVVDGECHFTITNSSSVATDIVIDMEDFSGGDANMTNAETGSAGATSYGAYSYYSGMTFSSKVIMKKNATGSDVLIDGLGATTNFKWGFQINTQTNAWAGSSSSTATITVTATKDT